MQHHQATPEELQSLQDAQLHASQTNADLAEAWAKLAEATANHQDATTALGRAITTILYGPQEHAEETPEGPRGSLYDLSNPAARAAWPTPPPAPGG